MKNYKMLVLDLDGTLLNTNKEIPPQTKTYLIGFQKRGGIIVLASGRPTSGMVKYADELKMKDYGGYLISYNGARLYSMKNQDTIWEKTINQSDAKEILRHIEKYDVIPMINDDNYMYVEDVFNCFIQHNQNHINIVEYESRGSNLKLCEVHSLANFVDFDLYKILLAGDSEYLKKNHDRISSSLSSKYNAMFTAPFYFEFTHKNADKGLALLELLKTTEINIEEIIGFGDDLNDLPFLELVGHPVVMSNANPALFEVINNRCGSNDEEGIYQYLKAFSK